MIIEADCDWNLLQNITFIQSFCLFLCLHPEPHDTEVHSLIARMQLASFLKQEKYK